MLKKTASFVLASFRSSTYQSSFSDVGNAIGAFPFAKIYSNGERPTRSAVCTSSVLHSLWPCWTVFLSILRGVPPLSQTCGPVKLQVCHYTCSVACYGSRN